MRISAVGLVLLFLVVGCSKNDDTSTAKNDQANKSTSAAPDNTAKNARDRDDATKTAGDQSENEADRTISQQVRQAIVADDSLSTNAKNVKIITVDGIVTLRGPVKSEAEKNNIAAKARQIAGVKNVENQLEIAS